MLKQDTVYKKKDCLGLDIGASSIKIVQLKQKKHLTKLVGYQSRVLPENLVIEGIISDHAAMTKIVKEMMAETKEGKFTAEKVIASIPDTNVFTRVLELPELTEKEMKEAIAFEADQSIPMAITDLVIDWQILGPSATKEKTNDILMVAAPLAIVNSYIQLFNILGFQPEAIETSLTAVVRALVSNKEKDEVIIVADIGAKKTNLGIYDNTLRFSDSVDFGGDMLTEAITSGLKVDKEKAEKMKKDLGLHDDKVKAEITPHLDNLKAEIVKVIRYHDERTGEERKIGKIILCGGSSNVVGLTEYLANELKLEVKIGNPWVNIDTYPIKPVPKSESAAYTNAIGLSLRSLEEL
ncbi:MAG: type IV pilus assembly protein PilM [Patescibacteria group bacterium]